MNKLVRFDIIVGIISSLLLTINLQATEFLLTADGKALTVANTSVAKAEIESAKENKREVYTYSLASGVLLLDHPKAQSRKCAMDYTCATGERLSCTDGSEVATVIGIERMKDGKILPFGYIKVSYDDEALPSGTFLYNAKKELVGISYAAEDGAGQGYVAPVEAALRGYEDYRKNGSINRSWVGIITSRERTVPEILSVRPASPAASAGLQKGDIILKVGNKKVSSYLEMVDAFYYLVAGESEVFTVLRSGEVKELELTTASW